MKKLFAYIAAFTVGTLHSAVLSILYSAIASSVIGAIWYLCSCLNLCTSPSWHKIYKIAIVMVLILFILFMFPILIQIYRLLTDRLYRYYHNVLGIDWKEYNEKMDFYKRTMSKNGFKEYKKKHLKELQAAKDMGDIFEELRLQNNK